MEERPVTLVGCGPGAPDHLTPAARSAIEGAQVLVGAPRLLQLYAQGAEELKVGADIPALLKEMNERLERGQKLTVLVTGDPGLCSLAQPVLRRFGPSRCRVIPGLSSVQVAFARLGLDWLEARVLSAHHRDPNLDGATLAEVPVVAVLLGRRESLPWLAELARDMGERRLFMCQDLTLQSERVEEVPLNQLEDWQPGSLTLAVLVKKERLS